MTSWQLATVIGGSLVAVIGVLWAILVSVWKRDKDKVDSLEQDKARLIKERETRDREYHDQMLELSTQVAEIRGREDGQAQGIEMIVTRTLEVVKDAQLEAYKLGQKSNTQNDDK